MRRIINFLCLIWIAASMLQPEFLLDFLIETEKSFQDFFAEIFPFFNEYFSLHSLAVLILLFNLATETAAFQRGTMRLVGLALRHFSFLESNQVLSLLTRSSVGERVEVDDLVKDICYVERRHNTWVLILLVVAIILIPGIYMAIELENALYLLPFVVIAVILFFSLLRGVLTIATCDGGATYAGATKRHVAHLTEALTGLYPGEFTRVTLSNIFADREVFFHASQVTGVVQVSRFPWGCLLVLLLSMVGAFFVIKEEPDYALRVIAILVMMLLLIIFLAFQKRLLVKMVGAHYYAVGNRSSTHEVLSAAIQKAARPAEPIVDAWAPAPQPTSPESANVPLPYSQADQPAVSDLFPQQKLDVKVCPSCGKENSADHLYCVHCGATL